MFFVLVLFVGCVLSLLLYRTDGNSTHQKQENIAPPGLPVRLIIPKISVDTQIENMGVTSEGTMEVPDNVATVGWFKLGPLPGERGSAVLAGHFDGINGEKGVFTDLDKLKIGDEISIKDSNGAFSTFSVREIRIFNPGYEESVFRASESAHLNLITCDGVWDGAVKSYNKRLVVFADMKLP
ncbi:MAG: class F sortase [Oligoflexia bacterium]|nr:class F sortase [Oligoflexia bacterium]